MKIDSQDFIERAERELTWLFTVDEDGQGLASWAVDYGDTLIALAKKGAEDG